MPIESVADLVGAVNQSRLLDQPRLDELNRDLAGRFDQPADLARELYRRRWLTLFQLKEIFLGRGGELVLRQYVLLDLLGEGGMGRVFKALHRRLDRTDALKVVRREHLDKPDALPRFQREARAAARLHHPNIVTVYDADEDNGVHFLAMEYVDGTDLARWVKDHGPLPVGRACDFVRQAALGLQHAHERGMVHRDIKPANLLLTADQRTVKVLDLGLARLHATEDRPESAGGLTHSGILMGTPDYMAPEQAVNSHEVDIRADVYGLGCTLHFLLTAAPPFPVGSLTQKLLWHQHNDPEPLEKLRPDLPPGLADVVRKMMAKRAADRHQTPGEAAEALAPWSVVADTPVLPDSTTLSRPSPWPAGPPEVDFSFAESAAVRPGELTSAYGDARRPRSDPTMAPGDRGAETATPVGSRTAVATVPPAAAPGGALEPARARPKAKKRTRSKAGKAEAGANRRAVLIAVVAVLAVAGAVVLLRPMFGGARNDNTAGGAKKDERSDEGDRPRTTLPDRVGELRQFTDHKKEVRGVAFSGDGKQVVSVSMDPMACVWDLEIGQKDRQVVGHVGPLLCVAWLPGDVPSILCGCAGKAGLNRFFYLSEIPPGQKASHRFVEIHKRAVYAVDVSPDGQYVLSGGGDDDGAGCEILLWDVKTETVRQTLRGHTRPVFGVAFIPGTSRAVSCSLDRSLRVWDLKTGKQECSWPGEIEPVLAVSPDGKMLLTPGERGTIAVYSLEEEVPLHVGALNAGKHNVLTLAFCPDGKRAVSGGADGTVRLWDVEARKELHSFTGHTDVVYRVAVSPDGWRALSCSKDKTVRLWGLPH
jgi:serine/threonine-protein kinase